MAFETLLESLGNAKGNMNPYVGELLADVTAVRHGYHAAVPQQTPASQGLPSRYCGKCGLRTENSIHHSEPTRKA